eukprot:comp20238_c0_seq1/m.25246 comp20238_c0_seq1/g.25246  ORF comp20238_c0_seq1/g.25246 comp20238_c0_seq1/m.25246 type:complete len:509 (-) comp20238_c0_seq1:385-1911(-)
MLSVGYVRSAQWRGAAVQVQRYMSGYRKVLTYESINHSVRSAEYAVRGEIPLRAEQLKHVLTTHPGSLPFKKIVQCNIGNPQELGQTPITFIRQVAALAEYPALLEDPNRALVSQLFPEDTIERAKSYKAAGMQSMGAYTHSQGLAVVRKNIASFIEERDNVPCDFNNIFMTNGASGGVQLLAQLITANPKCGMMIPIPQYPLYTATMSMVNGITVPYYLDEERDWALSIPELERALNAATALGVDTRALVVINPGNPTGSCLSEDNIKEIIDFCYHRHLIILADEVYQTNIYNDNLPFFSFKRVLRSMGPGYQDMELVSFHSTSKGFIGECGKRGGYFELEGFDPDVKDEIYKAASIQLCPNVPGQIVADCMVKPPKKGEPSFELYEKEKTEILQSLRRRAKLLVEAFNDCEGVTCNKSHGAMYSFPKITLPAKAIEKARKEGHAPDAYYSLKLLEATGVCTVPGSGFRQKPGTFHLRSTFLPKEEDFPEFIRLIKNFHTDFLEKHR